MESQKKTSKTMLVLSIFFAVIAVSAGLADYFDIPIPDESISLIPFLTGIAIVLFPRPIGEILPQLARGFQDAEQSAIPATRFLRPTYNYERKILGGKFGVLYVRIIGLLFILLAVFLYSMLYWG